MEVVMETVGSDTDPLTDCDEEDLEEEDLHDEVMQTVVSPKGEEEEEDVRSNPPPVVIIPIPVQPVNSCSDTHSDTSKPSGGPHGFMVNGRLVPLLPGGGGVELKLRFHPGGTGSGFTTVQMPVTLTVQSPAGTCHINTTASVTSSTTPPPPPPEPDPTPIITAVISGEAAQKVLNDHDVNFITKKPRLESDPPAVPPSRPAAARKLLRKGHLGPVAPPNCVVCSAQFKLITELRGFMCLCSPAIAMSLKKLKKKVHRRSREKKKSRSFKDPQTCRKVSRTQPGLSAVSPKLLHKSKVVSPVQKTDTQSDIFLSDRMTSPALSSSPQQHKPESPPDPSNCKLVIMVEDFYYGSDSRRRSTNPNLLSKKGGGSSRCLHCLKILSNNIKLMSHMQQHISLLAELDGDIDSGSSCPHCFRRFSSPFRLQSHVEAVHSLTSTATCKICELDYCNETDFLWHMKTTHKPGEMPYVCPIGDFRSSFYLDIWSHFQEAHADTNYYMCQYCLKVLRSSSCYQQHFVRHQRKRAFGCDQCRLHFLYLKDRMEHKKLHHRTHIKPTQLTGLKPGTKVTVRTYSVVTVSEMEEAQKKTVGPCKVSGKQLKVVDVNAAPPPRETRKRKPRESLDYLLSSNNIEATGIPNRCVECHSSIQDMCSHFPSLVRCSLCRFTTCCSKAYANHMINDHAAVSKRPQYYNIFQSDPKLSQRLKCVSCPLSTCSGDLMANHLSERPEHSCVVLTPNEPSVNGAEKTLLNKPPTDNSYSVTSSGSQSGVFIPINLLQSRQVSPQLSIKSLSSPFSLATPPAMTLKFLGTFLQPKQPPVTPLSVSQLSVLLFSLCNGIPQAAHRFQISPQVIQSWKAQQEDVMSDREWGWKSERMAEWVLSQREQQLCVSDEALLQIAREVLGDGNQVLDCYRWAVDFMLHHCLSLQTKCRHLPKNIRQNSHTFIHSLCSQIKSKAVPPRCVGFLDELSIFIDRDLFSSQNPAALKFFGTHAETPLFDVFLSALCDGTFLTPLLFYRGTQVDIPQDFPENVLLEVQGDRFTDQECLHIWTNKVWRSRLASDSQALLMVDVHRGHLTDEFQESLRDYSTDSIFIPAGCSCRLQPLDVCVTPVLMEFLQAQWTQLVAQGGLEGLSLDQLALTLACWLSEVSSTLNADAHVLRRSFALVCRLQEEQEEATKMIQKLNEKLDQPLETVVHPPPGEQLLLLIEDEDQEQNQDQKEDQESAGPGPD